MHAGLKTYIKCSCLSVTLTPWLLYPRKDIYGRREGAGGTAGAVVTHSHEIMNYYMYRASLIVCIATPTTVVTDV